ncbi:hypothetical protein ACRTC8_07895 [Vibrio cholerae]|uniref:hypothetical protein n=1 Tax=Vibrio cholerae TaxID=666 RepID=UPI001A19ECE7|nr:hypothetical protein [Vibrio cholerae]GHZ32722.1 hypothetical protein VCSRO3_0550 [Vibrio cholerae]HAS4283831.1 hypothetical protein [Vibrio cholerae]HAS4303330.1 hypothetical protein [Vibrio cholerae]HAS4318259.1 hypothetical protein [Vibrio cholerae]
MPKRVNFSRHLEKHWLEQVAIWSSQGIGKAELNANIERMLEHHVQCKVNRGKTRNQLMGIWFDASTVDEAWHNNAIGFVQQRENVPFILHWGMLIAKNYFFADVVRFIGRKSKHYDCFTYGQAQKYIAELYGDTETVKRSLRSVLKTLVDFEIILREKSGSYKPQVMGYEIEKKYKNWLVISLMQNRGTSSRSVLDLLDDLVWFPFSFTLSVNEIDQSLFDLHQQGNNLVLFRK